MIGHTAAFPKTLSDLFATTRINEQSMATQHLKKVFCARDESQSGAKKESALGSFEEGFGVIADGGAPSRRDCFSSGAFIARV